MHKTKNIILILAAIIIVGCLLYLPGINRLGFYRDAWNYFFNLTVRGPETLRLAFEADRPADGYLISFLYRLFGTNINAYIIWCLCCRILSSFFFALALLRVWLKTPKMAGLAGILAVVFPGFLQQVDVITYIPHQTAMLCFMLSLWLTALTCEQGQKKWIFLFTFLSILLSFANMMLMEYYVGMEIYRIALIYLKKQDQNGNDKKRSFFQCIESFLPYLIPVAGFLIWRVFFFHAERAGTDLASDIIKPLLLNPLHEIGNLIVRTIKSEWKLFAGVWTVPFFLLVNSMNMPEFVKTLLPSAVVLLAAQLFFFMISRERPGESKNDSYNEAGQWVSFGLICGGISILPLIFAGRDINFNSSLDRFSWPGMIGTILFLIGLVWSVRNRALRYMLSVTVVFLSIFVQWRNQEVYVNIWKNTQDYWQQLIWRVPSLEEGTTIVTSGKILVEEDYEIFSPASMIYYPYVNSGAWISSEVLSEKTIRDIKMGKKIFRKVRDIQTEKDYTKLLVLTKPGDDACMRIIDGEHPIYSLQDDPNIIKIGSYSKLSQIILSPEESGRLPFFIPSELEHNWCYYYAKIELALQMNNPELAASLADEADSLHLSASDPVEMLPVIEAYARSGRKNDAMPYLEYLKQDPYFVKTAADYLTGKDADLYKDFAAKLTETMTASVN